MKKILVTGADGFIGSHLVEKLVKKGYSVKAFVYYNSFNNWGWLEKVNRKILNEVEIVPGDIRDFERVKSAVSDCQLVFNLAALIGIPYSYLAPSSYIDTNVNGILNVLQSTKNKNIRIIQTSTSEVYGSPLNLPIKETHRLYAQSPYAASKIAADQMALSFYNSFNMPISIIRPFNTYGPRQSLRAVIPTIFAQILNPKIKKIKLGNIHTTRDFNYIDDTVDGFISTINNNKIIGKTINLGNSYDISIKKVVELIGKITKIKKEIDSDKKRIRPKKSEVDRLCASNELAKKILNWKPKYVGYKGFEEGLKLTLNWFKNETSTDKSENYTL